MKRDRGTHVGVGLVVLLVFLTLSAGCSTTHRVREVTKSGFLKDYSMLREGSGDEPLLYYLNPKAKFADYDKIIIDPVTVCRGKNSTLADVSPRDLRRLASYFQGALERQLGKSYRIVHEPCPKALRLRAAITQAKGSTVVLDIASTVLPQVRLISAVKRLAVGTHAFVGEAAVEGEILDAVTGERLMAGVDERAGNKVFRGSWDKWDDVKSGFDAWAEGLRNRLAKLRKKR
jgi:hypothetical protein